MKGMIPRDKLSRKARRALNREKRTLWPMSPVTRIRESGKVYSRRKLRQSLDD